MLHSRDRLVRLLMDSQELTRDEAVRFIAELVPVLNLAQLEIEDDFPDIRHGVAGGPVAAAALNPSTIQLRNPPGSNCLVVIETMSLLLAGSVMRTGFSTTEVADNVGTLTRMNRDRRGGDQGLIATIHGANNVAASITTVAETFDNPGVTAFFVEVPVWVVLPAGVFFNFDAVTANVAIRAHFRWHEFNLPRRV